MRSVDDNTFKVLRKNREIHTKIIKQFNGTLIKKMGDGMLICFDLPSDAMCCVRLEESNRLQFLLSLESFNCHQSNPLHRSHFE